MPEDKPEDKTGARAGSGGQHQSWAAGSSHRKSMTPEQRRFLGTRRAAPQEHQEKEMEVTPTSPPSAVEKTAPESRRIAQQPKKESGQREPPEEEDLSKKEIGKTDSENMHSTGRIMVDKRPARVFAVQHAFLIIGAIFVLCMTFYVGKKFAYWKYLLMTRNTATLAEKGADKFPGISSEQLVEQALAAERSGKWQEALDRWISAKRKDRALRGILFHVGKILLEQDNLDGADQTFENAIAFGEDLDTANYGRGLIAARRRNLPAAERFFEAAANANPVSAEYYFFWAEALRVDNHPRDAIQRYEQAALRTGSAHDEKGLAFKIRVTEMEAGGAAKVSADVEEKQRAGPLSLDWLMTAAALKIREGRIAEAVQLLSTARYEGKDPSLFATCVKDPVFRDAAAAHPEVAKVCTLDLELPPKFP